MGIQNIDYIASDKDSHFTGSLAQNAMEVESLLFPSRWRDIDISECVIEGISIQADQNLEFDVIVFSKASADDTDIDLDAFIDFFNFPVTGGKQIAGAGQFYYASPANNVAVPYLDKDNTGKLHVGLVNRSASAKNAGATGEVKITFFLRPVS